ncbi:MAG: GNAT family N-acetyltransferase [Defluviitaleaceae bacterium]|nr:GNAT family N-acetyltransferase [Defluviitaleaceae bacterium]
MEILELTAERIGEAWPVVKQLRPQLGQAQFIAITSEMMLAGYRAACLYVAGEMVGYAGFGECLNLYHGRHIWVYELVVDEKCRSMGYGEVLLQHVEGVALEGGMVTVVLSSGLQRLRAHEFYEEKAGYDRVSFVFKKDL